jgi:hypothetical protein
MKIKFGSLVVAGSGKIGGHVASKNRAGSYLRTKVTPVNPQTLYQSSIRNRLTSISQAWRGLTAAQRLAWNAAVGDFAKTDIFGDLRNPSGFNLHQRLNNNLLNIGEAVLAVPPVPSAVDAFTEFTMSHAVAVPAVTLTFDGAIAVDMKVKVFATAPQSAGKSFVKSEYRQIAVLDNADVSPYVATSDYTTKFGNTGAIGQKIYVKMVQVNMATGQEGTPIVASSISVA